MPSSRQTAKTDRIEVRVTSDIKALLLRAAVLQGQTLTDFVISSAAANARRVIRESELLELSERDQVSFAEALLKPPQASPRLHAAAANYRKEVP